MAKPLSLEQHLERLHHLSVSAEEAQRFHDAIFAEVKRGEACGFYRDVEAGAEDGRVAIISAEPVIEMDSWVKRYQKKSIDPSAAIQ